MPASAEDFQGYQDDLSGMVVLETELTAVTGDESDASQLVSLMPVLSRLRGAFGMEMVFIGQLRNGMLTGREASPDEGCDPFEEAYGRALLETRCGASRFTAVPVCSHEGIEAGTLVCAVAAGDAYQPSPDSVKSVSRLLATTMRRMTETGERLLSAR